MLLVVSGYAIEWQSYQASDIDTACVCVKQHKATGVGNMMLSAFIKFNYIVSIEMIVGRLARSQLNQEQVRVYVNEENNRRRNLLQKYIRLCNDAKVLGLCTLC